MRYFTPPARPHGVELRLGAGSTRTSSRRPASTRSSWPPASSRGSPAIPGDRPPEGRELRRVVRGERAGRARVAIIGAGGIGFDVGEFLTTRRTLPRWTRGVGGVGRRRPPATRGGVVRPRPAAEPAPGAPAAAQDDAVGAGLGKTPAGSTARSSRPGASACPACATTASTTRGCTSPSRPTAPRAAVLAVDTSCCAPARSRVRRWPRRCAARRRAHLIGGADVAAELDAKRAIDQGTELAAAI